MWSKFLRNNLSYIDGMHREEHLSSNGTAAKTNPFGHFKTNEGIRQPKKSSSTRDILQNGMRCYFKTPINASFDDFFTFAIRFVPTNSAI